jgi:signal transduction histidine kinase
MLGRYNQRAATQATGAVRKSSTRRAAGALFERWGVVLLTACVTALVTCRWSYLLSVPEFGALDQHIATRTPRKPDPRIVLIGIERAEIEQYQRTRPADCTCGLVGRDEIASVVRQVKSAGARVVALDINFPQACPVGLPAARSHDGPLRQALSDPPDTVVVANTSATPERLDFVEPPRSVVDTDRVLLASPVLYNPHGVIRGVSLMQEGTPTELDRRAMQPLQIMGGVFPPLGLVSFGAYAGRGTDIPSLANPATVEFGGVQIPVWQSEAVHLFEPLMSQRASSVNDSAMLISWVGRPGSFPTYAFSFVREASAQALRQAFGGKVVIIGSLTDRKKTPIPWRGIRGQAPFVDQSRERTMSGMEIHANVLDTVLQARFIRPVPPWVSWAVIFVTAYLTAAAFTFWQTSRGVGTAVALGIIITFAAHALIARDLWLYSVCPSFGIVLAGVVAALLNLTRARVQVLRLAGEIEARDAVTATLVHDLKQPLAAISALAAVLRSQQESGRGRDVAPELLARIQQQVELAFGDVDEMLTINRHREVALDRSDFDIVAMARDLAVAQGARSTVHSVQVLGPEGGLWVNGDQRYLGRVINNLLENAIKYWPQGGTVTVRIYRMATSALVEVHDAGMGIAPEDLERIFEPYQRAANTSGYSIAGSGIGLFSVKHIVEAHGGTVAVRSKPGVGSTFSFELPVAPVGAHPETG